MCLRQECPRDFGLGQQRSGFPNGFDLWGFSFKRADLHFPRRASSSEPGEEVGGISGTAESLEARADAGETVTILVVGSLQAGAELFMRLRL